MKLGRTARCIGTMALLWAALSSAIGCSPQECSEGETRCASSKYAEVCSAHWSEISSSNSYEWGWRAECSEGTACVMVDGSGATCVGGGEKDPSCAQTAHYCDGDALVSCAQGYSVNRAACGSAVGSFNSTHCIPSASAGATCIPPSSQVDPICGGTSDPHCDGSTLVDCVEGYAVFRANCRACTVVPQVAACSGCAPTHGQCSGYLGDSCQADSDCAAGLLCHLEAGGLHHCSAPCTVSADAQAGGECPQKLGSGDLPLSSYAEIQLGKAAGEGYAYPPFSCIAGFCAWNP